MNSKEYKMPGGRVVVFDYDDYGIGRITLEMMDVLMDKVAKEPKWIPCGEGLPEDGTLCLVSIVMDDAPHKVVTTANVPHYYDHGWIDAWMPLPEPYERRKS